MSTQELRIHAAEPCSLANGPGKRTVVWVQGCGIRCPRCWNTETHDPEAGTAWGVSDLVDDLLKRNRSDRVLDLTISGGEPLDQAEAVLEFIKDWRVKIWERYRSHRSLAMDPGQPTIILFSGYDIGRPKWRDPAGKAIWRACDVVVAGPFSLTPRGLTPGFEMSSCETQITYNLTHVIKPRDLWQIPGAECIISPGGKAVLTGMDPGLAK